MNKNIKSFLIGAFLTIFMVVGATGAIYTAWRMNQPGPVAPNVPQIKPHAQEPAVSAPTPACGLTFTVTSLPELKCDSVKIDPTDTNIGSGDKRTLTVSGSGGQGTYTYSWTMTSDGTNKGTLNSSTNQTVTWTAPTLSNKSQTWTFTASLSDGTNVATSDSCKVTLSYNFSPSCNSTCQSSADCPSNDACSNGRCRNPSCTSQSDCKCPPPLKVCNDTCTVNADCQSQYICAGGNCRNPSCITQPGCVCPPPVAPPPPVTPVTPVVYTHKTCQNNACVTVNGRANDSCTSDASCQPKATPPPIPKSGVDMPTILTILGGVALLAIGLVAL